MNKKNQKIIAIAAAVLAVVLAAMGLVYHFFGPQTKLEKIEETTEIITEFIEETEAQTEESLDETTEAETQTEAALDETAKAPSKKPATKTEPATKKPQPTKPVTTTEKETVTVPQKKEINLTIEVKFLDGTVKTHEIKTTANNLGDALLENKLVEGTKSQYGLFITTVDGVKADDAKQQWWCITKGGVMTPTGADTTPIADGDKFELTLKEGY